MLREKLVTRQQDEVHNEHEDVGYELLEVNRQEQDQRGVPTYLVINLINVVSLHVLEYAD